MDQWILKRRKTEVGERPAAGMIHRGRLRPAGWPGIGRWIASRHAVGPDFVASHNRSANFPAGRVTDNYRQRHDHQDEWDGENQFHRGQASAFSKSISREQTCTRNAA